jgi:hypothetical protein
VPFGSSKRTVAGISLILDGVPIVGQRRPMG